LAAKRPISWSDRPWPLSGRESVFVYVRDYKFICRLHTRRNMIIIKRRAAFHIIWMARTWPVGALPRTPTSLRCRVHLSLHPAGDIDQQFFVSLSIKLSFMRYVARGSARCIMHICAARRTMLALRRIITPFCLRGSAKYSIPKKEKY